ncbi:MAG: VacJ family lipoprotein [Pseudomonadota bacterium]|uniref:Phospholipid-binding lipoprotein MlaA n=1 Tax=Ectopseudomonas oleovorans TaxID=301 RepID=A0A653B8H4_ECTOL|nr:Phospholipid-binding lipoprotein MlaA [Pseudomonas oleovorans]
MAKHSTLIIALLLASAHAWAGEVDADGFTNPLQDLKFNPGLDQQEFERASSDALRVYDPLEPWNRRVYHFNYRFDQWVFLPVVKGYRYVTPNLVQSGVHNFFSNLGEIPTLANSLLQLKGQRAMNSTARLLFNTIIGVGGIWDPATMMGLPRQEEDFGQTLGHYGVPAGPYLMLPLLGPSNVRDTAGLTVDYSLASTVNYLGVVDASLSEALPIAIRAVDERANTSFRYGQLNSPFEYEKIRYFYHESRKLKIAD